MAIGARAIVNLEPGASPCDLPGMSEKTSDTPPDRLSVNPDSPYYDADVLQRNVGVRFKGQDKTNVEEYCVSEGWVKVPSPKTVDRKGKPLLITLKGAVEVFYR